MSKICFLLDVTSSSAPKSPIKHTPPTLAKPSSTTNGLPTNSISKQTTTTAPTSKTTTTPLKSPSQCHRTVIYHDDDDDEVAGKIPNGHISTWSTNQVVKFVTPRGCKKFASVFQEQVRCVCLVLLLTYIRLYVYYHDVVCLFVCLFIILMLPFSVLRCLFCY